MGGGKGRGDGIFVGADLWVEMVVGSCGIGFYGGGVEVAFAMTGLTC